MRTIKRIASFAVAIGFLAMSTSLGQIVFDGSPGTAAPPGTLGPYTMTGFGLDPAALYTGVTSAPGPTGNVGFSATLTHYRIGSGWATWPHGYSGDVYYTGYGNTSVTMTMPPNTSAFYFYAEPQAFAVFTVQATSGLTSSGPINVNGYYGATYFGFYTTGGGPVTSVTVSCSDPSGFAVGEFGVAQCAPTINVALAPAMLWPPNHKMVDITATVSTFDPCGLATNFQLMSLTSNEPDNGPDDGNTINDIQDHSIGFPDVFFKLRAERSGIGTGRIYTATYKVFNSIGNWATASATVMVPLSMSKEGAGIAHVPGTLELDQNFPNPFNPTTTIRYALPHDGHATLTVYDLVGREVATLVDGDLDAGTYETTFVAENQASGMYIYRLMLDGQATYRTMTLSK